MRYATFDIRISIYYNYFALMLSCIGAFLFYRLVGSGKACACFTKVCLKTFGLLLKNAKNRLYLKAEFTIYQIAGNINRIRTYFCLIAIPEERWSFLSSCPFSGFY